jgi:hypothetical protein
MPDRRPYNERIREKIQTAMVADRLIKAFNGEVDLTPSQVSIGLALIKKVVPDQKAVEQNVTGEVNQKHSLDEQSVEQAAKAVYERIKSIGKGDTEADS